MTLLQSTYIDRSTRIHINSNTVGINLKEKQNIYYLLSRIHFFIQWSIVSLIREQSIISAFSMFTNVLVDIFATNYNVINLLLVF